MCIIYLLVLYVQNDCLLFKQQQFSLNAQLKRSVVVIVDTSFSSPQKVFIFILQNDMFRIKVYQIENLDMAENVCSRNRCYNLLTGSPSFFKIKSNIFLDTMIQERIFSIMKIITFWGNLINITANKEALLTVHLEFAL